MKYVQIKCLIEDQDGKVHSSFTTQVNIPVMESGADFVIDRNTVKKIADETSSFIQQLPEAIQTIQQGE